MGAMVTTGGEVNVVDVYSNGGGPLLVVDVLGLVFTVVLDVSSVNRTLTRSIINHALSFISCNTYNQSSSNNMPEKELALNCIIH